MKGLSDRSTLQYTFEVEGRLISVEGRFLSKAASGHNINSTFNGPKLSPQDFMKREYGIELRHPHLPCVEINAHVVYPVELVSFCRQVFFGHPWSHAAASPLIVHFWGNHYRGKLSAKQQEQASRFQVRKSAIHFLSRVKF